MAQPAFSLRDAAVKPPERRAPQVAAIDCRHELLEEMLLEEFAANK
jgi:hypothetical protein